MLEVLREQLEESQQQLLWGSEPVHHHGAAKGINVSADNKMFIMR